MTIEEKNNVTYLRTYTNWRYQVAEKTRVGVRLLGHFLRGSSMRGAPKEQMEIIEIPLFERPLCVACCGVTGDLLVGCPKSLVLFSLKKQALNDKLSILDFERCLILHLPGLSPQQVGVGILVISSTSQFFLWSLLYLVAFSLMRTRLGFEKVIL